MYVCTHVYKASIDVCDIPHDILLTFFIVIIANNNEIISKPRHVDIVIVAAVFCFFSFQPVIHQRPLLALCTPALCKEQQS